VAPGARVPSDDRPVPGLTVELVVNENDVPAPVAVVGKKFNTKVPLAGVAPPAPAPNGSAVVLATARPVSNGGNTNAYGISIVVLAGTMLTTVSGPTSKSVNVGYPLLSVGKPVSVMPPGPLPVLVVSNGVVDTGNMVAVTVIEPGVVTAAVVVTATAKSTSRVSIWVRDVLVKSITAVLAVDVMLVLPMDAAKEEFPEVVPIGGGGTARLIVTPVGTLLNVSRI
jgi:hypothetical protein